MSTYLDKEHEYSKNRKESTAVTKEGLTVNSAVNRYKNQLSKHDTIRQHRDEFQKLARIEKEIGQSTMLKKVNLPEDTEDFENLTNREFNKNYEQSVRSRDGKDENQFRFLGGRITRNRNNFTLNSFNFNETQVNQFTFKQRNLRN